MVQIENDNEFSVVLGAVGFYLQERGETIKQYNEDFYNQICSLNNKLIAYVETRDWPVLDETNWTD